jgi:hypothetical protein
MALARESNEQIKKRYSDWQETDQTLSAYIPLSDYEKSLKAKDKTRPVSIVVPYSYAAMETILAYNVKAFLNTQDIFQYEGCGPEDTVPATLLQLVVNQQLRHFKSVLDIHTGFRDGLAYGFGASAVVWTQKYGRKPIVRTTPRFSAMGTPLGITREKVNVPTLLFEGNKMIPLDPYKCLPDPGVSAHKIQDGRFFGWYDIVSLNNLISDEQNSQAYFNVKYLQAMGDRIRPSSLFELDPSKRSSQAIKKGESNETNDLAIVYMYLNLIPAELGLPGDPDFNADGTAPEIWSVAVANDTILIDLGPLDLNHQSFPVAVNSPDFDGYSIAPISKMEMDAGLQKVLNFSFNSHMANVRKALHDMFIVDPSLVSMKDLQNPEPGKYIRLRRNAWGKGVDSAIKQLQVNDITKGNIQDAAFVMDLMNRVGATSDASMGAQRRGGPDRVTAAEFSGTFGGNISRLDRLAVMTSLQYMHDLAFLHASHTQQLMSEETYVKAVGEWPQVLQEEYGANMPQRLSVDPFSILASFDIITKDGSEGHQNQASLGFWTQVLPMILQQPTLYGILNVPQILKHIARLSGEKNVRDFVLQSGPVQAKMVGDAELRKMVTEGNAVPVTQGE